MTNHSPVAALIEAASAATTELRAQAKAAARALVPLRLEPAWQAAAAAVPLIAAGVIGEAEARRLLGPERSRLATQAAKLPQPRLAAREALEGEDPAQAEALRRLFLALAQDLRIVPLVLAAALARLETLKRAPAPAREAAAHEVFILYAPLANRLGIWQLKWPFEDLALRLAEPRRYAAIARGLAERREAREARLAAARRVLEAALAEAAVPAQISGRPKHIYSIWRKMQRKEVALDELYDLMGLRVVVDDIAACYAVLGIVHERWRYLPQEFDDYIAAPKGNFYRSLHTAVLDDDGRALEVQIRTAAMHREAELGVAAHWHYKEGGPRDPALEDRLAWLRQVLASGEDTGAHGGFVDAVATELASERIYALTPRGRVVDLPTGATPLDFAYAIHTGLG
ncbi:MAG: HD domain-containing protein, partial [Acetobacteraceae bacterium]